MIPKLHLHSFLRLCTAKAGRPCYRVLRPMSTGGSGEKDPRITVPGLAKSLVKAAAAEQAPTQLGVSTKNGKLLVTSTGDSLIIEKATPKEPIQIVRIEADQPQRDVSQGEWGH